MMQKRLEEENKRLLRSKNIMGARLLEKNNYIVQMQNSSTECSSNTDSKNIEKFIDYSDEIPKIKKNTLNGLGEVKNIANKFKIDDIHFIKPGLGETMRAIIRKKPDVILIKNEKNKYTEFMKEISEKNEIPIKEYPFICYNVCAIYKDTNSDIL